MSQLSNASKSALNKLTHETEHAMTLVVARKQQNRITIAADSQVYNLSILHLERTRLIVKVIRLSPTLVVAFAGTIPLALRAIKGLTKLRLLSDLDALLSELLEHNRTTNNGVDFIVASLTPEPTLSRISDGVIEKDLSAAWIGNKQAFADYQRFASRNLEHQVVSALHPLTPWGEIQLRMHVALREVIESQKYSDVSGFVIRVADSNGIFIYCHNGEGNFISEASEPTDSGWRRGSASEGTYSYQLLVPHDPYGLIFGIHFFEGCFGLIFSALQEEGPEIIRGVDFQEFITAVVNHYRVVLKGEDHSRLEQDVYNITIEQGKNARESGNGQ